mmetsp:Transcript_40912/g.95032  ORF Transcript_40912/g.95032 Transcript_40912/m.95032 type:complete len:88 (+) Transcript_40912:1395-1658(+)
MEHSLDREDKPRRSQFRPFLRRPVESFHTRVMIPSHLPLQRGLHTFLVRHRGAYNNQKGKSFEVQQILKTRIGRELRLNQKPEKTSK